MEELRSTEVLDREILEDARKKAYRILKTADDTLAAQKRDWEKKTQEAVDSIRKVYTDRIKRTGEEIYARLPLDKRRLRSETAESSLVRAMGDFLRTLPREKLLDILAVELSERLEASLGDDEEITVKGNAGEGVKTVVLYSGQTLAEACGVLGKVLASLGQKSGGPPAARLFGTGGRPEDWDIRGDAQEHEFPSIVINTQFRKITASIETAAAALMKDKRAELAAALLGEGVLND